MIKILRRKKKYGWWTGEVVIKSPLLTLIILHSFLVNYEFYYCSTMSSNTYWLGPCFFPIFLRWLTNSFPNHFTRFFISAISFEFIYSQNFCTSTPSCNSSAVRIMFLAYWISIFLANVLLNRLW
jgi:hypothetical protein